MRFEAATTTSVMYTTSFAENMTAAMFHPQSCKSCTFEEKMPESFHLHLLHTTFTVSVR